MEMSLLTSAPTKLRCRAVLFVKGDLARWVDGRKTAGDESMQTETDRLSNNMRTFFPSILILVWITSTALAGVEISKPKAGRSKAGEMRISGDVKGHNYETIVHISDVTNAPIWSPERDNPPLAVRDAERLARKGLARTVWDLKGWTRDEITLLEYPIPFRDPALPSAGYWIYSFHFFGPGYPAPKEDKYAATYGSQLTVIVLMNGKAVCPEPD